MVGACRVGGAVPREVKQIHLAPGDDAEWNALCRQPRVELIAARSQLLGHHPRIVFPQVGRGDHGSHPIRTRA